MTTADTIRLDQLDARIRSVWSRGQTLHLLAGAFAFVRWEIPLFRLGVFIDWMTYMPAPGRVVILLIVLGVPLYRAWRCGWRYVRPFDAVRTTLQLESHYGDLKSLLISAIQLRRQTGSSESNALRNHTCLLAEEAAKDLQPRQAVPFKPLQRPAVYVALCAAVLAIFATVNSSFFAAGMTRIFTPWVIAEYPTNTQITLEQEELIVQEGNAALITAQLTGVIPETATIYVRTGEGRARAIDLEVFEGSSAYTIASASRDFTYRIKAGDDRTPWHTVRVVPAPRIEQVQVNLDYPDYLDREQTTIEALTLTVPEGTGVDWQLTLDRPIQSAMFVRDGEDPLKLEVGSDGRTLAFTVDVAASQGYHFTWVDREQGFEFTSPRYFLQVAADQAPRVELTEPMANLVAMIGRPMDLAVRTQDDHGIGSTKVAYRVNQFAEQAIELAANTSAGQGEQPIDWDYRETLPDLQVGDTVSFSVQVSDRYPGEQGPHVVRSETRRITFLSEEQYLEQIEKQRDRLLSRVQTIYRQQRSAHELVRTLALGTEGYIQTCQLESIRQAMVRDQLEEIANQLQGLLDDLAANNMSEAAQASALEAVRTSLSDIATTHVTQAASLLRDLSNASADDITNQDAGDAALAVNASARELGSLVLLRGINPAQEVFAREMRMLAQAQAALRWQAVSSDSSAQSQQVSIKQSELADWTDRLINDLQAGMRYEKRPLAVLRLVRSVKDLKNEKTTETMRRASELIKQKETAQASALQADLVKTLLNAEFSIRLSGAYATLVGTRDLIGSLTEVQKQLRIKNAGLSPAAFSQERAELINVQTTLRKELLSMLLPTVPAPRAKLFDESPSQAPPIDAMLSDADLAMRQALTKLQAGEQQSAVEYQLKSERVLAELLLAVEQWSVEMGLQSQGLSTLVADTSERMSRLEEFEARVIDLLEKTDLAAADEKKVDPLAESQMDLAIELGSFIKALNKQTQTDADPDLLPLLTRLEAIELLLNEGTKSLQDNDADQAIGQQEQAADALIEAYAIVTAQNERLTLLQSLLMFQRSVRFANGYMADIVAEQRDLLQETEALTPEAMPVLLPRFAHMRDCMDEIAPLLDLIAARLDVGTPLVFAKTDFEDAMISLETGDQFDAIDAQDVAAESIAKVQGLVGEIQTQTGYVAEIVAYLHASVSDAAVLAYEQDELRLQTAAAQADSLPRFIELQRALLAKAQRHGQQLIAAAGTPLFPDPEAEDTDGESFIPIPPGEIHTFLMPAKEMQQALADLQAGDAVAAAEQMDRVGAVYAENAELLLSVITMLHGLPETEITSATEPELLRLINTLALASRHKQVFRFTQVAADDAVQPLADEQRALSARLIEITAAGITDPLLSAASKSLSDAAAAFESLDREALKKSQRTGDEKLRHFIVQQALILNTAIPPASASDPDPAADGEGSDEEADLTAGFIADFVSGETPSDKRSEWQVLAERNRAALNQNFARELPLEYRGLLKNYYERVAK
ncbi:MAG: hypothetical protein AB8C95_01665 [Phycisphaeraceae bacterium]